MVERRLDCEHCRHLTVVGPHDAGPRCLSRVAASVSMFKRLLWPDQENFKFWPTTNQPSQSINTPKTKRQGKATQNNTSTTKRVNQVQQQQKANHTKNQPANHKNNKTRPTIQPNNNKHSNLHTHNSIKHLINKRLIKNHLTQTCRHNL